MEQVGRMRVLRWMVEEALPGSNDGQWPERDSAVVVEAQWSHGGDSGVMVDGGSALICYVCCE